MLNSLWTPVLFKEFVFVQGLYLPGYDIYTPAVPTCIAVIDQTQAELLTVFAEIFER
jgi:hypothetical protein